MDKDFDDVIDGDDETLSDDELDKLLEEDDQAGKNDDVNYKDKYEKSEKSRRHQQKFVSKLQDDVKKLNEKLDDMGKSTEEKNKALAKALGFNNPDDDEAKKIVEEYESDPVKFIDSYVEKKLNERIGGLDTKIEKNSLRADVTAIMEELEGEYEVEYTQEFASEVSRILNNFDKEFRLGKRKEAILMATKLAMGDTPLKKRGDGIFIDNKGKFVGLKGSKESQDDKIRKKIMEAGGSKDIFA